MWNDGALSIHNAKQFKSIYSSSEYFNHLSRLPFLYSLLEVLDCKVFVKFHHMVPLLQFLSLFFCQVATRAHSRNSTYPIQVKEQLATDIYEITRVFRLFRFAFRPPRSDCRYVGQLILPENESAATVALNFVLFFRYRGNLRHRAWISCSLSKFHLSKGCSCRLSSAD